MLRNGVPGNRSLTILLHIKAKGFVGAAGLACSMLRRRREQTQAGMQQRLGQQSGKGPSWAFPGANRQRAENAAGQAVICPEDAGFHGARRDLSFAIVTNQADPDLLGAKQERKNMDGAGPIRIVPGVLGYEHGMPTDGSDDLATPVMCYLHPVTPMKRYGQAREVGYVGDHRRSDAELRKVDPPDPRVAKKLL